MPGFGGSGLTVTLVVSQLGRGGTEQQVVLLARGLRDRLVDVDVVALCGGGPRSAELEAAQVPVRVLGLSRSPRHLLRSAMSLVQLAWHLRRRRCDVAHAFLYDAYVTVPPIARLVQVPVVVTGRRALGTYKQHRPVALWLERRSNRLVDAVVANAHAVAEDAMRQEGLPRAKVRVIQNGLLGEPVVAPERGRDVPVVICVANLHHYKGHHDLLAASALLIERGIPHRLVLVGDGPCRSDIERAAVGLPVELLGERDDVPSLLASSDVFVLPSYEEGMSNALMEAMAAPLAVVATDVGGNAELMAGTGLLCPPRDPEALARAMATFLTDEAARSDAARAALARARGAFSIERLADEHLRLYQDLLTVRKERRGVRHQRAA